MTETETGYHAQQRLSHAKRNNRARRPAKEVSHFADNLKSATVLVVAGTGTEQGWRS
ncbi:hypothetical protein J7I88_22090 [Paraburkholderia strydomiana]|nr:hypothetical protein [Paraburkholderia strydomiana]